MTSLFTSHPRTWRDNRYVYPVVSRRSRGLSIGVNLNPDKVCNFDCVYCSVDRSVAPVVRTVDEAQLAGELEHLVGLAASGAIWAEPPFAEAPAILRRCNDVAFSGDGEPTAYPHFPRMLTLADAVLRRHSLDAKVVVITNATLLDRPAVAEALVALAARPSEVWAKLDAGTEDYYQQVERTKVPLAKVLANLLSLGRRRPLVIQALFMCLHGQPPPAAELDAWLARLAELHAAGCRIERVQVYTTARDTAESFVTPLDRPALDALGERVRSLGLAAEVFYGPG